MHRELFCEPNPVPVKWALAELGRKKIRTDAPTEKLDAKVLETLVELDDPGDLPVGLRVDAYIEGR